MPTEASRAYKATPQCQDCAKPVYTAYATTDHVMSLRAADFTPDVTAERWSDWGWTLGHRGKLDHAYRH